jgi:hypothetical protein
MSPSSCLQTKFQIQQKTFMLWAQGRKDLVIRISPCTDFFQDLCARVVTSHAIKALVAGPSTVRNSRMGNFNLHCQGWVACWEARDLRHGERRHKDCGSHGMRWVQEWQDQQDHHFRLQTTLMLWTWMHLTRQRHRLEVSFILKIPKCGHWRAPRVTKEWNDSSFSSSSTSP